MIKKMLSHPYHDWSKPVGQGPKDIGFEESYISNGGIQGKGSISFIQSNIDLFPTFAYDGMFGMFFLYNINP